MFSDLFPNENYCKVLFTLHKSFLSGRWPERNIGFRLYLCGLNKNNCCPFVSRTKLNAKYPFRFFIVYTYDPGLLNLCPKGVFTWNPGVRSEMRPQVTHLNEWPLIKVLVGDFSQKNRINEAIYPGFHSLAVVLQISWYQNRKDKRRYTNHRFCATIFVKLLRACR